MDTYLNAVKPTTATTTMTTTRHVFGLASNVVVVVVAVAICIRVRRQLGAQNAVHIINHFSRTRRGRHRESEREEEIKREKGWCG